MAQKRVSPAFHFLTFSQYIFYHDFEFARSHQLNARMKFRSPLIRGTIVKRYRRSLVDVKLDNGRIVTAHSPSLGPMTGCYEPGRPAMLSDSHDPNRKHPLTWELIDMGGIWVGVNPSAAKKVLVEAIDTSGIPSLAGYETLKETTYGRNKKTDLILQGMEHNCFINTYSVSWAENDVALFPDAVSTRATTQLRELAEIPTEGHRSIAFFLVQRSDCSRLTIAAGINSELQQALRGARNAGVEILVYRSVVSPEEITLGSPIPCIID